MQSVEQRQALEKRVVRSLVFHLARHGWHAMAVDNGGDFVRVGMGGARPEDRMDILTLEGPQVRRTAREVWAEVNSVDDSVIVFRQVGPAVDGKYGHLKAHAVQIVLGNDGWDAISDWGYSTGDADGFNATMEAFDVSRFEPK